MEIDINTVKWLVFKDWDLHRKTIAGYLGGGALGLAILAYPHAWALYMGCVILMTLLIAGGFHVINVTIIGETKGQTTPFILSLPVRPSEYALGKILANLVIFLALWTMVVSGVFSLTLATGIPDGLLPFFIVIGVAIAMNYAIVLSVALATESEGWSIFTMVFVSMLLNPLIMLTARNPEFHRHFETDTIVWNDTALTLIPVMGVVAITALGGTLFKQARRTTFI
jgi:hypothetical protein